MEGFYKKVHDPYLPEGWMAMMGMDGRYTCVNMKNGDVVNIPSPKSILSQMPVYTSENLHPEGEMVLIPPRRHNDTDMTWMDRWVRVFNIGK